MVFFIIMTTLVVVLIYGFIEKQKNKKYVSTIPIRVNVNGIRGKSTITRLITSILSEAGYHTIGKTTGTASRIITNQNEKEYEINRGKRGVSISEQLDVIRWASQRNAEALVCECMAVNPEYQRVYQEEMIQANYGVIINVLEDHMDLLGPSLDEVALSFSSTIPYNGNLIIQDNEYKDYFSGIAEQRNTVVWVADEREIPEGYLDKFNHILFPNNIAIALAFAKSLGISKEIALDGMLKMNADPGTLKYHPIKKETCSYLFINGFAINDPQSVLEVIPSLREDFIDKGNKQLYFLFNARKDRVDRSQQFIKDVFSKLDFPFHLIVIGESTKDFDIAKTKNKFKNIITYNNYEQKSLEETVDSIESYCTDAVIFSVGNIHGRGYELLDYIYHTEGGTHGN